MAIIWYEYLLTTVHSWIVQSGLFVLHKKEVQLAQVHLMCLDCGTSALCSLGMFGGNLLNELIESKALACLTNLLGQVIALNCFIVLTTLNSYVR